MLWSLLLLLGLVAAEGLFPISLPKNEIPRHLRILGRKMDSIFVFFLGARKNKKYKGKRAEEPLKNLAVFMTRVERSSARNNEKFCWALVFFVSAALCSHLVSLRNQPMLAVWRPKDLCALDACNGF